MECSGPYTDTIFTICIVLTFYITEVQLKGWMSVDHYNPWANIIKYWDFCLKLKISGNTFPKWLRCSGKLNKCYREALGYFLHHLHIPVEARGEVTSLVI